MESIADLKIGQKYKVACEDCCLQVYFTATLLSINHGDELVEGVYEFDNGVRLDFLPSLVERITETL